MTMINWRKKWKDETCTTRDDDYNSFPTQTYDTIVTRQSELMDQGVAKDANFPSVICWHIALDEWNNKKLKPIKVFTNPDVASPVPKKIERLNKKNRKIHLESSYKTILAHLSENKGKKFTASSLKPFITHPNLKMTEILKFGRDILTEGNGKGTRYYTK